MDELENKPTQEELLGPPKIDIVQVGLTALGSFIAGFSGAFVILASIYLFLKNAQAFLGVYPYIYGITGFFATVFTAGINIFIFRTINPDKYKRGSITFVQTFLLSIFLVIFLLPIYIAATSFKIDTLVYIFIIHVTLAILGNSIFLEILSNYRYLLLGLYGSFIGTLVSILLTVFVLFNFQESGKNLYILVGLIILINFASNTIRALFEYVYYLYYSKTGMDQLGDIFYQIEEEEKEIVEKAKRELEKFN